MLAYRLLEVHSLLCDYTHSLEEVIYDFIWFEVAILLAVYLIGFF